MAEAYPVGFQWVMKAKARGAPLIHIDPRFTPTSALADRHVTLRAGTDIAFLGGVINYILSNGLGFREYDPGLEHPRCVFQILKRHFARYPGDGRADLRRAPGSVPAGLPARPGPGRSPRHRTGG